MAVLLLLLLLLPLLLINGNQSFCMCRDQSMGRRPKTSHFLGNRQVALLLILFIGLGGWQVKTCFAHRAWWSRGGGEGQWDFSTRGSGILSNRRKINSQQCCLFVTLTMDFGVANRNLLENKFHSIDVLKSCPIKHAQCKKCGILCR